MDFNPGEGAAPEMRDVYNLPMVRGQAEVFLGAATGKSPHLEGCPKVDGPGMEVRLSGGASTFKKGLHPPPTVPAQTA
ncbi:hypothetical protein [Candidatus Solincola tengchongensis]|uniref:hypothetical protein n=1 Tax=Candidatus Solincola tengchongensis TaxID=2900693 RepID=UPI00257D8067|nr:hypothetical protein [Candidatus Solincola tengchongensis]